MKFLDCTIRDGGYINRWKFSDNVVKNCYSYLDETGFDYIELGFRNKPEVYNNQLCGKWRYCTEDDLRLCVPEKGNAKIAVMMDFSNRKDNDQILPFNQSCVDMIRVAFHRYDLEKAMEFCKFLKNLGYEVCANAMATVHYSKDELGKLCSLFYQYKLDYLYIADSCGSLNPHSLSEIHNSIMDQFKLLDEDYNPALGFHAHNNQQNSFANFLYCMDHDQDFKIIDSTVLGMGRGAGNLPSELVASHIPRLDLLKILKFAQKYIQPLLDNDKYCNWGYRLDYLLSAHFKCHPNYISKLIDYEITNIEDQWKILSVLVDNGDHMYFNKEKLEKIIFIY